MIDYDMPDVLRFYASQAAPAPMDLVGIVEHRHRRRARRRRLIGLVTTVLVVAAATGALLVTGWGRGPQDIVVGGPPVSGNSGFWNVQGGDWNHLPSISDGWGQTVVDAPTRLLNGTPVDVRCAVDRGSLVVTTRAAGGGIGAIYRYDGYAESFRLIANLPAGGGPVSAAKWACGLAWVVWSEDTATGFDVYRAPLAGGPAARVASVATPGGGAESTGPWYTDDQAVYYSGIQPGVVRVPLNHGSPSGGPNPVQGYENMYLLSPNSPWTAELGLAMLPTRPPNLAVDTATTLRVGNVNTGQLVDVAPAATASWLECGVVFCLGADANGHEFLQAPSGGNRVQVNRTATLSLVGPNGGVISWQQDGGTVFWDPESGAVGFARGRVVVLAAAGGVGNEGGVAFVRY